MRLGAFALCLLVLALAAATVAGCVSRVPSQARTVSAAGVAPGQAGSGQTGSSSQGETDSEQDSGL